MQTLTFLSYIIIYIYLLLPLVVASFTTPNFIKKISLLCERTLLIGGLNLLYYSLSVDTDVKVNARRGARQRSNRYSLMVQLLNIPDYLL
jgi:hypothetical protein